MFPKSTKSNAKRLCSVNENDGENSANFKRHKGLTRFNTQKFAHKDYIEQNVICQDSIIRPDAFGLPMETNFSILNPSSNDQAVSTNIRDLKNLFINGITQLNCWNNEANFPFWGYQILDWKAIDKEIVQNRYYFKAFQLTKQQQNKFVLKLIRKEGENMSHVNPFQNGRNWFDRKESNSQINVFPQKRKLNLIWSTLENKVEKEAITKELIAHITTIVLYKKPANDWVFDKFLKVIFYEKDGRLSLECYILNDYENNDKTPEIQKIKLCDVERLTKLKFLNKKTLSMMAREDIESHK